MHSIQSIRLIIHNKQIWRKKHSFFLSIVSKSTTSSSSTNTKKTTTTLGELFTKQELLLPEVIQRNRFVSYLEEKIVSSSPVQNVKINSEDIGPLD